MEQNYENEYYRNENPRRTIRLNDVLKRWCFFAIAWPLLCCVFAVIIVFQPGRKGEERFK